MKNWYIIKVHGGIEPELAGPYRTEEARDKAAKRFCKSDDSNSVFWLDAPADDVKVGAYSNKYIGR